jgi:hypothetical protein
MSAVSRPSELAQAITLLASIPGETDYKVDGDTDYTHGFHGFTQSFPASVSIAPCLAYSSAMKTEAVSSSERLYNSTKIYCVTFQEMVVCCKIVGYDKLEIYVILRAA